MSIDLTGTYGYFTRQGTFIGAFNRIASLYGSAITSDFQAIWSLFATSDQAAVQNLPDAVAAFRQSGVSYQSTLAADGAQASILQANDSSPLVPYTYFQSVTDVRDQMIATSPPATIQRPTLTATPTAGGSNLGNSVFYASTTNIYGDPLDMTLTETFTCTCSSQGSGFQSSWGVVGLPSVTPNSWNWPQGSGASTSITTFDPAIDGIVSNGGFETFTVANTPDNWTIVNGSAGVTVFEATALGVRTGTNAVYLQSDGSSLTKLEQQISVQINTVYAVTFVAKMNTGSAGGTCVVSLTDAAGTVINNDAGSALSASYTLNGGGGQIGTSYAQFTVFFSTPRQLPSTGVFLRIGYGTAATSTRQLYLDLTGIQQATPLYGASGTGTAGPYIVNIAYTLANAINDTYSIAFTNSLTTKSFCLGLQRLYGLRELGLYLPSAVSATISDSLVTY